VLEYPQVLGVTVKVEKVRTGSGRVGVEIRRQRAAAVAKVYHLFPSTSGKRGPAD
jgi:acyl-CoA thioesterase FadM